MKGMLHDKTVCYGTGSGAITPERATVVFVHGAGFDHAVWVMPARYFARHKYNVVAPDLPAHGGSAGPALASVEAMADWLHELLASLGVSRVTVVGHSMGSLVALAYAQRYAGEVEGIALLGTASPMTVGPVLLDAAADNHPAAFAMANTWSHSHARLGDCLQQRQATQAQRSSGWRCPAGQCLPPHLHNAA
ncbi:MAG: alpha/beta fold hydrolase, partial [Pseudomonadota bacterium]